jgi:hypothetical protein
MRLRDAPPLIRTWYNLMLVMVGETISGSYMAPAMLLGQSEALTEYFWMNRVDPFAHSFLYREFPEQYGWDIWRKNGFEESKEHRLAGWCMHVL